ncbi:MAG: transketolase [Bacteroidota bacterium]|nr:transketolase [Bacteroidota bacterium]
MPNETVAEPATQIDQLSVNTIRFLSVDMVQKANSGHPGLPLGAAPMAYVLWQKFLRFDPKEFAWPNHDRFILSAGHGSALLYSLLNLYGYDLPMDQLKQFRQVGSKTPGHPESMLTDGIEVTTGPLGQGFGNGIGSAMAEAFLAARYNKPDFKLYDHFTYGIVSDGDLMEGVASEAASLAGHLKLGKIIYMWDDNHISLDGPTSLAFTEDVLMRFEAYDWHTQMVEDGNDLDAIERAIILAQRITDKPSIIAVKTVIGFGSPQEGTSKVHGNPLGEENLRKTKENLGWDPNEYFYVPEEVKKQCSEPGEKGAKLNADWKKLYEAYGKAFPKEHGELVVDYDGKLPEGWDKDMPVFKAVDGLATRQAFGKALTVIHNSIPWMLGGSADLAGSNEMPKEGDVSFQPDHYGNGNVWFGVREHGMGAIMNGISSHRGVRTYGGTFLTFSDYMRGAIRLAALTEAPVTYVFTHDSIGLGEDGPTHQPIEQVTSLRAIPNLTVIRPGDANETVEACRIAMTRMKGPVALILSRQKMPNIDQEKYAPAKGNVQKGAYILSEAEGGKPDVILIGTGSELNLCVSAQEQLKGEGIKARVVSMPSWELFDQQDQSYRDEVLPPTIHQRVSVEAGITLAWWKWITAEGIPIGIDRFGESGPAEELMKIFGFTVENVIQKAKEVLKK